LARVQALIAGTLKHFPNGSFTLGNTTYTTASLVALLQSLANTMIGLNVAQLGAKDAMATQQGTQATVGPVVEAYQRFVQAAFSNAAQTIADFGLAPPKVRTPLSSAQLAARAAKTAATREARGTTSKKQKLAITGNVTGVTVTPVTAPTAAPPLAQPVSTTPSAPIPGTANEVGRHHAGVNLRRGHADPGTGERHQQEGWRFPAPTFLLSWPRTDSREGHLDAPKPMTAFVGSLYVGTDRLGRPLTNPEKNDLSSLLREQDFVGASMISLRFAFKLRRSKPAAQDLQGRAHLRLITRGWDWKVIPLVKCLCRFVWSEHTHEKRESAVARRAEEVFLREEGILSGNVAPSAAELAVRIESERQEEERNTAQLDALRASFTEANDEVNLLWLDYTQKGISDPEEMACESRRKVEDFYLATKRRENHVMRLAAAAAGVKYEEDT
jgi:hypothetical protein